MLKKPYCIQQILPHICLILAIVFIGAYIFLFMTKKPIYHIELITTQPFMTMASKNSGYSWIIDQPFIDIVKESVKRSLNVSSTEASCYRPRVLSFFIQYIDANVLLAFSKSCIFLKQHLIGYWFSFFLCVTSLYIFCRKMFPTMQWQYALCIASCFPLIPCYQISSYLVLRSAKLITPSIVALLFLFFFKAYERFSIGKIQATLLIFLFVILATLDEQILAVELFLLGLSVILSIFHRKINVCVPILLLTIILYLVHYRYIAPYLLGLFTNPPLILDHPHKFTSVFNCYSYIMPAFLVYKHNILRTFSYLLPVSITAFSVLLFYMLRSNIKTFFITISCLIFSFVLFLSLICAHPHIWYYKDIWESMYALPTIMIVFITFLFACARTPNKPFFKNSYQIAGCNEYKYYVDPVEEDAKTTNNIFSKNKTKILKQILFLCLIITTFFHMYQANSYYNSYVNQYTGRVEKEGQAPTYLIEYSSLKSLPYFLELPYTKCLLKAQDIDITLLVNIRFPFNYEVIIP